MQKIADLIRGLLAQHLKVDIEKIKRDSRLREDLGATPESIDELIPLIEKEAGISFPEGEDFCTILTFDDLTDYVTGIQSGALGSDPGFDDEDVDTGRRT